MAAQQKHEAQRTCGATHIAWRLSKKQAQAMQTLSEKNSTARTPIDSFTHLQRCLGPWVDQATPLASSYCGSFSQAGWWRCQIPHSSHFCCFSTPCFKMSRKISSLMFSVSLAQLAASMRLFRFAVCIILRSLPLSCSTCCLSASFTLFILSHSSSCSSTSLFRAVSGAALTGAESVHLGGAFLLGPGFFLVVRQLDLAIPIFLGFTQMCLVRCPSGSAQQL